MNNWNPCLQLLKDLLVKYFESKSRLRQLTIESGLHPSYITEIGTAHEYCTNIILEAQKQGRLNRLTTNAYAEYDTPYLRAIAYIIERRDCGTIASDLDFEQCYDILAHLRLTHKEWLRIYQSIWPDSPTSTLIQYLHAMLPEYGFWSTKNTVLCVLIDLWHMSTEENRYDKLVQLLRKVADQTGDQQILNWISAHKRGPGPIPLANKDNNGAVSAKTYQPEDQLERLCGETQQPDGTSETTHVQHQLESVAPQEYRTLTDSLTDFPLTLVAITALSLLIGFVWFLRRPDYEPLLVILASISAFVTILRVRQHHTLGWDVVMAAGVTLIFLLGIFVIQFQEIEQPRAEQIEMTALIFFMILVGMISVVIGVLIMLVGSGLFSFAPQNRLRPNSYVGAPNWLEVLLGFVLIASGIIPFLYVLGTSPVRMLNGTVVLALNLALIGLILILGFVRLRNFTIYKRPNRSKASKVPERGIGVLLFTIAVWLLVSGLGRDIQVVETPSDNIKIVKFDDDYLQDGETVPPLIPYVSGTYEGISEDSSLWVILQSGSRCYPVDGPAMLERTNTWRYGAIEFPKSEREYLVHAVVANAEASNQFKLAVGKTTGLQCFPDGAESVEILAVTVDPG